MKCVIDNKPLVAIHCLVYNHEPYLRDCFEGFVMQQTNFPFVAVVHDDASTDASSAIIHEYEEKYPHIFKPIYEAENQYSKRDGSLERIMDEVIDTTDAKYVAMCEGDDYWTDPLKLQKQVDFMEANPEYAICFHKVHTLIQETGEIRDEFIVQDMSGRSTILDLAHGNYIHTPSVLFRVYSSFFDQYHKIIPCLPGDYVMWMLLAERGYIYKFDEPMAVYRYGSGIWSDKQTYKNSLSAVQMLCKLSVVCDDDVKQILMQFQLNPMTKHLYETVECLEKQLFNIRHSYAYRLGKFILKPFSGLRNVLKCNKR